MFSEHILEIFTAVVSVLILSVLARVLQQILFRSPNEPPVVFHWLPFIGSTVTYGLDPFKFFFECQAKVRMKVIEVTPLLTAKSQVWRHLHVYSPWQESHGVSRVERQSVHLKWQTPRRQCRRNLLSTYHPSFRERRCL